MQIVLNNQYIVTNKQYQKKCVQPQRLMPMHFSANQESVKKKTRY